MEPGQRDDDVFNNPVSKIIVVGVSSKVLEGEHGDGWQQFFAGSGRHADAAGFDFESVSLYRFLEILELEIAEIANLIADRTTHQIVDCFGQDDSARVRVLLETCGNIDSVAVDVFAIDDDRVSG